MAKDDPPKSGQPVQVEDKRAARLQERERRKAEVAAKPKDGRLGRNVKTPAGIKKAGKVVDQGDAGDQGGEDGDKIKKHKQVGEKQGEDVKQLVNDQGEKREVGEEGARVDKGVMGGQDLPKGKKPTAPPPKKASAPVNAEADQGQEPALPPTEDKPNIDLPQAPAPTKEQHPATTAVSIEELFYATNDPWYKSSPNGQLLIPDHTVVRVASSKPWKTPDDRRPHPHWAVMECVGEGGLKVYDGAAVIRWIDREIIRQRMAREKEEMKERIFKETGKKLAAHRINHPYDALFKEINRNGGTDLEVIPNQQEKWVVVPEMGRVALKVERMVNGRKDSLSYEYDAYEKLYQAAVANNKPDCVIQALAYGPMIFVRPGKDYFDAGCWNVLMTPLHTSLDKILDDYEDTLPYEEYLEKSAVLFRKAIAAAQDLHHCGFVHYDLKELNYVVVKRNKNGKEEEIVSIIDVVTAMPIDEVIDDKEIKIDAGTLDYMPSSTLSHLAWIWIRTAKERPEEAERQWEWDRIMGGAEQAQSIETAAEHDLWAIGMMILHRFNRDYVEETLDVDGKARKLQSLLKEDQIDLAAVDGQVTKIGLGYSGVTDKKNYLDGLKKEVRERCQPLLDICLQRSTCEGWLAYRHEETPQDVTKAADAFQKLSLIKSRKSAPKKAAPRNLAGIRALLAEDDPELFLPEKVMLMDGNVRLDLRRDRKTYYSSMASEFDGDELLVYDPDTDTCKGFAVSSKQYVCCMEGCDKSRGKKVRPVMHAVGSVHNLEVHVENGFLMTGSRSKCWYFNTHRDAANIRVRIIARL